MATDDSVLALLAAVQDCTQKVLAGLPCPPSSLRIQAGEVSVEVDWGPTVDGPAAGPVPAVAAAADDPVDAEGRNLLRSPSVGSFYRAPEPGASPFVEVGEPVRVGQQVAIVEIMKLMIPVKAEVAGTVAEVLREDGDPVEHGEPLMAIAS
jgi:acetyl-CoA carboxylase biotin carboxyl carrier protein